MDNQMKLDLVTVMYEPEILLQKVQARSILRHLDRGLIENIFVVINEDDPRKTIEAFKKIVLKEYGELSEKVVILSVADLFHSKSRSSGWKRQQTIKLMVANKISTENYMVLDCKNHFIKPTNKAVFFNLDSKKILIPKIKNHGSRQSRLEAMCKYFNVDLNLNLDKLMPITTPFVLSKTEVLNMISEIEKKEGRPFPDFFHAAGIEFTEFFLYAAYLYSKPEVFEELYEFGKKTSIILWETQPKTAEELELALETLNESVHVVSLHRKRAQILTDEELLVMADYWTRYQLFDNTKDAKQYILEMKKDMLRINDEA